MSYVKINNNNVDLKILKF